VHLAVRAAAGNPANCRSPARISPAGLPPVRTTGYSKLRGSSACARATRSLLTL